MGLKLKRCVACGKLKKIGASKSRCKTCRKENPVHQGNRRRLSNASISTSSQYEDDVREIQGQTLTELPTYYLQWLIKAKPHYRQFAEPIIWSRKKDQT